MTKEMLWWNSLPKFDFDKPSKRVLSNRHYKREPQYLTESHIKKIYEKEVFKF